MGGNIMKKLGSRLILGILTCIILFCIGAAIGCKETKEEKYTLQVGLTVYEYWPEFDIIFRTPFNMHEDDAIENNWFFEFDSVRSIAFELCYYIRNEDNVVVDVVSVDETITNGSLVEEPVAYYTITNDDNIRYVDFCYDIHDHRKTNRAPENYYQLRRESGLHKIFIKIPDGQPYRNNFEKYGITQEMFENEQYVLSVNIKEETRKTPEIELDTTKCQQYYSFDSVITNQIPDSEYYRQTKDLFVFEREDLPMRESGGDQRYYVPPISVKDGDAVIIDNALLYESEAFYCTIRRMDETYHNDAIVYDNVSDGGNFIEEKGVYLIALTYRGNDTYAPVEYLFYFIVV